MGPGKPFQPSVMFHISFLGPFLSYDEENVMLFEYGPWVGLIERKEGGRARATKT
jgi:hypothetical protein